MRQFNPFAMGPLCDPVTAVMGGVGLVGNALGGFLGKSAASDAAAAQAKSAQEAKDLIGTSIGQANAPIADATQHGQEVITAGGQKVTDAAGQARADVAGATGQANDILNPYATAGAHAAETLDAGLKTGGDFNKVPTLADIQIDPGFAFRQREANEQLSRSTAARGGAVSGAAIGDSLRLNSGLASQEYANAFQRYQDTTNSRYSRLFGVSEQGRAAGTQQGNNLTASARYGGDITTDAAKTNLGAATSVADLGERGAEQISNNITGGARSQADLLTQKGNAQAAGIVGGTNALTSGITGGINSVGSALTLGALLKNPAAPAPGTRAAVNPNTSGYWTGLSKNPDGSLTLRR